MKKCENKHKGTLFGRVGQVCMDVRDERGNTIGSVCVVPAKDFGKRNIIFMRKSGGARSLRSVTELMNELEKHSVPFEVRKEVMSFVAERLRALELEEVSGGLKIGPVSTEKSEKKIVEKK